MYTFTQDILNKLSQEQKDKFLLDNLNINSTLNSNFIYLFFKDHLTTLYSYDSLINKLNDFVKPRKINNDDTEDDVDSNLLFEFENLISDQLNVFSSKDFSNLFSSYLEYAYNFFENIEANPQNIKDDEFDISSKINLKDEFCIVLVSYMSGLLYRFDDTCKEALYNFLLQHNLMGPNNFFDIFEGEIDYLHRYAKEQINLALEGKIKNSYDLEQLYPFLDELGYSQEQKEQYLQQIDNERFKHKILLEKAIDLGDEEAQLIHINKLIELNTIEIPNLLEQRATINYELGNYQSFADDLNSMLLQENKFNYDSYLKLKEIDEQIFKQAYKNLRGDNSTAESTLVSYILEGNLKQAMEILKQNTFLVFDYISYFDSDDYAYDLQIILLGYIESMLAMPNKFKVEDYNNIFNSIKDLKGGKEFLEQNLPSLLKKYKRKSDTIFIEMYAFFNK